MPEIDVVLSRARMAQPRLTVLGVYRPVISRDVWKEQFQVTRDEHLTRKHFEHLVLIEAVVEGLSGTLQMSKFGQMQPATSVYPQHMQVGYDEGLLSADGELLIQRKMKCVQGSGALRFAVYLHMYDPERPLQWQCGEVDCPPVEDAPVRLSMLMPYRACS